MKNLIFLFIILVSLRSCLTNEDKPRQVLEEQGFTNIRFTGYSFFMCSDKDTYSTGFEATSPTGKEVKGAVCGGFMKGYTVRFE